MRLRKIFCPQSAVILSDDAALVKKTTRSTFQMCVASKRSGYRLGNGIETDGRDTSLGPYEFACRNSHNNEGKTGLDHRETIGDFDERLV